MAKYDKDTDYMALINQAVAAGDYKAAGEYERLRNAKIAGEGLSDYQQTHSFGSVYDQAHFTNDELGTAYKLRQAAEGGGTDWDSAHAYTEGIRSGYGYSGGGDGSEYIKLGTAAKPAAFSYESAPAYVSKYQDQIDALTKQILGRAAFSYDPETDPAYQQYRESYTRNGQRAMQDTLGQLSARTGGLASSYAGSAAQQTYDGYMSALADKVPQLRQLAYEMYLSEGDRQRSDLSMLQALESSEYGKYQDRLGQYNTDRSFAYGQYRDGVSDLRYADETAYNRERDQLADQRYEDETAYGRERDRLADALRADETAYSRERDRMADQRYEDETAYSRGIYADETAYSRGIYADETEYRRALEKAQALAQSGDFSGYRALGYSESEIAGLKAAYDAKQKAASGTGDGAIDAMLGLGDDTRAYDYLLTRNYSNAKTDTLWQLYQAAKGSGSSGGTGSSDADYEGAEVDMGSVLALGFGPISETQLAQLESEGRIESYVEGGKIRFRRR